MTTSSKNSLLAQIGQTKPFQSPHEEAALNLRRTANVLEGEFEQIFKIQGITGTQYNVLRILRGAGAQGLCRNQIRDRLLTRTPDVTRLLARMEDAGLITRRRSNDDRRVVGTVLTKKGQAVVNALDEPVRKAHQEQLGHMSEAELGLLTQLLTKARAAKAST